MARQSQQTVRAVRIPPSHAPRATAALLLACAADPVCRWLWPDPATYIASFPALVQGIGGAAFASESAFSVADCRGAALWLGPREAPDERALIALFERSLAAAQRDAAIDLLEQLASARPEAPHWSLSLLGVEPLLQDRGFGDALLRPMLHRCDESNVPAYVTSTNPRNLAFYERLGFTGIGVLQVEGGPSLVPMLRLPR